MVRIIAIRVIDRIKESGNTQRVLSSYSSLIKTRLGFHELNDDVCSREGYILLQLNNDENNLESFLNDLDKIYGIEIKHLQLGTGSENKMQISDNTSIAIAGILISKRDEVVDDVQKTLTSYGCTIRTRLGINHEDNKEDMGLILLELTGDKAQMNGLMERLSNIDTVSCGVITFHNS